MSDKADAGAAPTPAPAPPTKEEETTDIDSVLEEAREEGAALAAEEIQDRLDEAGIELDPETGEVLGDELAFDPRPRRGRGGRFVRGGKRRGTRRGSRHRMYDPRPRRRRFLRRFRHYDPAPRRRPTRDQVTKIFRQVTPMAGAVGLLGTYYIMYRNRAQALGITAADGSPDAVAAWKQDVQKMDIKAGVDKLIADLGPIVTLAVVGYALKKAPLGPAVVRQLGGNLIHGAVGGRILFDLTDPPPGSGAASALPIQQGAPTMVRSVGNREV